MDQKKLLERSRKHYEAIKKALRAAASDIGTATTIGMVTTMLLRLHTDEGRPAVQALVAMAGALGGQKDRVSLEDMDAFRAFFLAARDIDPAEVVLPAGALPDQSPGDGGA